MSTKILIRGIALTPAIFAFALLLTTCGGSHRVAPPIQAADSLDSALAELDALETPAGVDPALFAQLKDALADALNESCRAAIYGRRDSIRNDDGGDESPPYRCVSTPPTGDANKVTDLAIADNGEGTYTLTWHYRNSGDYDQNGVVAIEDIIPLAVHFGESYELSDRNCLLAVIDGSGNGTVDIADITPIAMNLGVECVKYNVEGGDSAEGAFNLIQEAPLSEATGVGRLEFSVELDKLSWDYYCVVPYDSENAIGIPGYVASLAPIVHSVSPLAGTQGSAVVFVAAVTGLLPLTYVWGFEGGTVPSGSHSAYPRVTLREPGSYPASLTVSNSAGEDSIEFTLVVLEAPPVTVNGRVVEREDENAGVPGITVEIIGEDLPPGVTDNEGYYEIPNVPVGSHTVKPTNSGWLFWPGKRWINASEEHHTANFEALQTNWHVRVVAVGGRSSFSVVDGCPAVSYYVGLHSGGSQLRFMRANDADGLMWDTDAVTVTASGIQQWFTGQFNSLAVINGAPAISCKGSLNYYRALNPAGSEWGAAVVVAEDIVPRFTSLLAVNDSPAIAYYDGSLDRIEYVRASDRIGSLWGEPVTLCDSPAGYPHMDFAVIAGNPAVSYNSLATGGLVFQRAEDSSGDIWSSAVAVDSGSYGYGNLLLEVNGNPAIVYDVGGFDFFTVKYVRSTDAQGSEWGEPVVVTGGGCFFDSPSLAAICNDRPAVVCAIGSRLGFIESEDVNGSVWGDWSTIDADWYGGAGYGSLSAAIVNGHPAVSYTSFTCRELRYAVYIP